MVVSMRKLSGFLSFFFIILLVLPASKIAAQNIKISGTVISLTGGYPIRGVTVVVVGSARGTFTDSLGRYELVTPSISKTLRFTCIGYKTQEVDIAGRRVIDVALEEEAIEMQEVKVTALGIMRAERSTGYALQSVKGEDINRTSETSLLNALQGKVAGAIITSTSGAVGASSRIVLRGINSLNTDNQPLFVVDNVVLSNANFGNTTTEGVNRGSGVADINPNDIEDITVLKGPNAAALYGSRAANGVIIIKTKSADVDDHFGVSFNSTITMESPMRLPEFQNKYGQGSGGLFEFYDGMGNGINDNVDESWGPPLDIGLMIPQWNSPVAGGIRQPTPWISHPDNVKNFFETGMTFTNNVSVEGADESYAARFSYTNTEQKGMVPNTDQSKNNVMLNASISPYTYLTLNASLGYVNTHSDNLPAYGYDAQNVMQQFLWFGRQVDVADLRQYRFPDGSKRNWNYSYHNNPYFTLYENLNGLDRDRLFGQGSINLKFTDWLNLKVGAGIDYFKNYNNARSAFGDIDSPLGYYGESHLTFRELNTDFLLSFNRNLSSKLSLSFNLGGNLMRQYSQSLNSYATELSVEDVYTLENSRGPVVSINSLSRKQINSLFYNGQLVWKNALFFDFTGRNDWSSTLPLNNNTYFYPSFNLSAVLSDLFDFQSPTLNMVQVRAGWAQVGTDTDPYQLQPVYRFDQGWHESTKLPAIYIPNDLPNPNLKPQRTNSLEVGATLKLFMSRLGIDLTYYNQKTFDQIIRLPVSATTGYTSKIVNAGEIDNSGIELTLDGVPVRTRSGFEWSINLNFAWNKNEVKELAEGLKQYVLGGYWSLDVLAIPGQPVGTLYGYDFKRNENGKIIFYDGLPAQGEIHALGNYTPDWTGSIANSLRYKNLSLNFLIDARFGGEIYSMTSTWGRYAGVLKETLKGREGGIIGVGVMQNETGEWVPNNVVVTAEEFNKAAYNNNIAYSSVFDASFVKLREISLGYTFNHIANNLIKEISIAVVGRNLALLYARVPHIDPETAFSNSNVQGLEFGQLPSPRSYGLSLNLKF